MTMISRTIQPQWTSVKTVSTERTSAAKMPLSLQRQKLFWSLHQIISLESRSLHISLSGPEAPLSKFLLRLPEYNLSHLAFVWVKICQMSAIWNEKAQIIWVNSDNLSSLGSLIWTSFLSQLENIFGRASSREVAGCTHPAWSELLSITEF